MRRGRPPAESPLFLGLDLGTSSLKALVTDERAAIVTSASAGYSLRRTHPGWAEQEPADWWAALIAALGELRARDVPLARIAAIGLSGQMHGLVLLDAGRAPLGPCQTWADNRCAVEARSLERRVGRERLSQIVGSRANASATAAKLLWLRRHEPERWQAAAHLLLPKDYLRLRLTGVQGTDVTDASGTLLYDVAAREWSAEVLGALGIPAALLPPITESIAVAGALLPEAAAPLGLRAGIPVIKGAGDAECAAIGHGLVGAPDDAGLGLATLGTAGQFFAVTSRPVVDVSRGLQTLCHAAPDRWHVMGAILTGASALDWLAATLATPGSAAPRVHALLDEAINEPAGARGLLFLPYLNGTRMPAPDPHAAGAFVGLRPAHTRATLTRAVVEGVALALREGMEAARAAGIRVTRVRLAGGAAKHPLWERVLADVFGVPVERGTTEEASALGAALLAAVGSGALPSLATAAQLTSTSMSVTEPDSLAAALYVERAAVMRQLAMRLRPAFQALDA